VCPSTVWQRQGQRLPDFYRGKLAGSAILPDPGKLRPVTRAQRVLENRDPRAWNMQDNGSRRIITLQALTYEKTPPGGFFMPFQSGFPGWLDR